MMRRNRSRLSQHHQLCEKCLLQVADRTINQQQFIDVFRKCDRRVFYKFTDSIMSIPSRAGANVFLVRQALKNSLVEDKIDKIDILLNVLDQSSHEHDATAIRTIYHENIKLHKETSTCQHCPTNRMSQSAQPERQVVSSIDLSAIQEVTDQTYSRDEKLKLSTARIIHVLGIGPTLAGKTSMIRTVILHEPYLTRDDDRTVVAQLLQWNPPGAENTIFLIMDVGGHESYRNSFPYFHVNSPSSICLLCHDITSTDYEDTFHWLKISQENAPDSKVLVILTKMDEAVAERKEKCDQFVASFSQLIDQEIKLAKDSMAAIQFRHPKEFSKLQNFAVYVKHVENYNDVKEQIHNNPIMVSCKPEYTEMVEVVRKHMQEFAKQDKTMVQLNIVDQELMCQIAHIGMRDPMVEFDDSVHKKGDYAVEEELEGEPISPAKSDGKEPLKVDEKKTSVRQQYATLPDVMQELESIFRKHNIDCKNLEEQAKASLKTLNDKGVLNYFTGDPDLEQVVFNNISTLINLFRCIFHHDMENFLKFDELDASLRIPLYGNSQKAFQLDVEQLQDRGVLSIPLLKVFLVRSHCLLEPKVVVKLLERLDEAITFVPEDCTKEQIFVPFFINKTLSLPEVEMKKKEMKDCGKNTLCLQTILKGKLPEKFFYKLQVKIYRKIAKANKAHKCNHAWDRGFIANLGEYDAKILMIYNDQHEIEFFIKADISAEGGHQLLWNYICYVHTEAHGMQNAKWQGLAFDYVLVCPHCEESPVPGATNTKKSYEWFIDDILSIANPLSTCSCSEKELLPAALVMPLVMPLQKEMSDEYRKKKLEAVKAYLKQKHDSKHCNLPEIQSKVVKVIQKEGQAMSSNPTNVNQPGGINASNSTLPMDVESDNSSLQSEENRVSGTLVEVTQNRIDVDVRPKVKLHQQQYGKLEHPLQLRLAKELKVAHESIAVQLDKIKQRNIEHHVLLSNQIHAQGKIFCKLMALDAKNATNFPISYRHPVLAAHKEDLQMYLDVTQELMQHLLVADVLTEADLLEIQKDDIPASRRMRLLRKINESGEVGLLAFIKALEAVTFEKGSNVILERHLRQSFEEWEEQA